MSKRHNSKNPPDPAADYREWTEHRYTPGYFTGGRLSPLMKTLRDGGDGGRMMGACLIGAGLLSLLGLVFYWRRWRVGDLSGLVVGGIVAILSLVAGISSLRRASRAKNQRRHSSH